jgi:ABC-type uncharacterized transport system permease subunit
MSDDKGTGSGGVGSGSTSPGGTSSGGADSSGADSGGTADDALGGAGVPDQLEAGHVPVAAPVTTVDADQIPEEQRAPEVGSSASSSDSRFAEIARSIATGSGLLSVLAVIIALVVGALLIIVTNPEVQTASTYFFGRPADTFAAMWHAVSGAYVSLFQGGVFDPTATSFAGAVAPILNSIGFATPLIAAGLGIALAFRAGLFNIGAQGQLLIGGMLGGWVGFALPLPPVLHLIVAVLAAIAGGALWAFIVGFLKARTGAHEVIVTIMLNYVAVYLLAYLLTTPFLQAPGSNNPKSPDILPTAQFPNLLGTGFDLNLGIVLVVVATVFTWWLLGRSSLGFKFRAVGENAKAARVAGIDVPRIYIYVMVLSGALVGLASAYQVLGQGPGGITGGLDAGIGFNAITVALLGRSRPWGVFAAGILFGIFEAGGYRMQAAYGVNLNIVSVVQSVIVLFIAAPPLVRTIFRLPTPGSTRKSSRSTRKGLATN